MISVALVLASLPTLAQGLYQCPGNLFTNQMDPAQARVQGCVRATGGRLSLAQAGEPAPHAAPTPTPARKSAGTGAPKAPPAARPAAPAYAALPSATPASLDSGQRERDSQARAILQTELARTQSQLQALSAQSGNPDRQAQLDRLRNDEAALQRELARRPG